MDLSKQSRLLSTLVTILLLIQVALSSGIILKLNAVDQTISNSLVEQRNIEQVPQYVENVSIDDDPALGAENTPVTIVEFSDFECPFCAQFASNLKIILSNNTGVVKCCYRPNCLMKNESKPDKISESPPRAGETLAGLGQIK